MRGLIGTCVQQLISEYIELRILIRSCNDCGRFKALRIAGQS